MPRPTAKSEALGKHTSVFCTDACCMGTCLHMTCNPNNCSRSIITAVNTRHLQFCMRAASGPAAMCAGVLTYAAPAPAWRSQKRQRMPTSKQLASQIDCMIFAQVRNLELQMH